MNPYSAGSAVFCFLIFVLNTVAFATQDDGRKAFWPAVVAAGCVALNVWLGLS